MEDRTEKSAVTPGPLAPARELLGEMLLAANQPTDALEQFESTLKKEPGRFRALYGAGKAAQLARRYQLSRKYFGELLKVCERADRPRRAELLEAEKAVTHDDKAMRRRTSLLPSSQPVGLVEKVGSSFRVASNRCLFRRTSMRCLL